MAREWTVLDVGGHHGLVGPLGDSFKGSPAHYDRIDVVERSWADERIATLEARIAELGKDRAAWVDRFAFVVMEGVPESFRDFPGDDDGDAEAAALIDREMTKQEDHWAHVPHLQAARAAAETEKP